MQKIAFIILCLFLQTGCVNFSSESGVENLWRQQQSFENGQTTNSQVLKALGPPSQILAVGPNTIYYYLKEEVTRQGLLLLIYNNSTETVTFDRAIFIFNKQGILEDFSYSKRPENNES